jgi:hypothetical protein
MSGTFSKEKISSMMSFHRGRRYDVFEIGIV